MDIAAAITAASEAIGIYKALKSIDRSVDEAAWKMQLAELGTKLADIQLELVDTKNLLQEKDVEIANLRETIGKIDTQFSEVNGYLYQTVEGEPVGLPFCPKCRTSDAKLYRLTGKYARERSCPNCNNNFPDARKFLWPDQQNDDEPKPIVEIFD